MLCLTRIKRSYIIEHVMPSDLDDKDLKHGLYLKEKMIQEMTDDYIKENFPNWKELERNYRKNGISDVADKLTCGEMSYSDVVKPKVARIEIWMRWKEFKEGVVQPHPKDPDGFKRYETYDFDRMSGYSEWIKSDENSIFHMQNVRDIMVQFQIAIIGENAIRYYPFQDMSHYSGFQYVQDDIKIYDPQVWPRTDDTSEIIGSIGAQEEYYRLFFKNYKGYYELDDELPFIEDYEEWINANYPDKKEVRTLQTDPFRIKYDPVINYPKGTYCTLTGQQWIKTNYKTEMLNLVSFKLNINNTVN